MTTITTEVPIWHTQGDTRRQVGVAHVQVDPDTGETQVAPSRWDHEAALQLQEEGADDELECFLLLSIENDPDRTPLEILALPVHRYRLSHMASMADHPTATIP